MNERDGGKQISEQTENTERKGGKASLTHTHTHTHGHILKSLFTYTRYREEETYGLVLVTEGFLEEAVLGLKIQITGCTRTK